MITLRVWINIVWRSSSGLQASCEKVAFSILAILVIIEIIREAIDMASGRGFALDRRVIAFFVAGFAALAVYSPVADSIYKGARTGLNGQITQVDALNQKVVHQVKNALDLGSSGNLGVIANVFNGGVLGGVLRGVGIPVVVIILIFLFFATNLIIFGMFGGLIFTLHCGPIFIVFLAMEETRNWFFIWLSHIISYIVQIIFLSAALEVANKIIGDSLDTLDSLTYAQMEHMVPKFLDAIIGPLFAVAVLFISMRVARSLTGGAGGNETLSVFGSAAALGGKAAFAGGKMALTMAKK